MTSPENPLKTRMSIPVKSIMKIDLRRPPAPSPPAVGNQGLRSQEPCRLSGKLPIPDPKDAAPRPGASPPISCILSPISHPPKGPKPCPRPS